MLRAPAEKAKNDVAVAIKRFGEALHDEIRAQFERPAKHGRGERVVDDQRRAPAVGDLSQSRNVNDFEQRVGDRFRQYEPGVGANSGLNRLRRARIHRGGFDSQPPRFARE